MSTRTASGTPQASVASVELSKRDFVLSPLSELAPLINGATIVTNPKATRSRATVSFSQTSSPTATSSPTSQPAPPTAVAPPASSDPSSNDASTRTPSTPTVTNSVLLLAHSASMTRAAVPFLPVPSAALEPAKATAYVKKNWSYVGGISKFIAFVQDPYPDNPDPEMVFRVQYPKGSEGGGKPGTAGGIPSMMLGVFGDKVQGRSIISYKVAFDKDFDFVNGGKLPGVYGGHGECSGGLRNTGCFSARLMWRRNGTGEVYCYIPGYSDFEPDPFGALDAAFKPKAVEKRAFGISLDNASWNFTREWNEITQVVILNSDPGRVGPANGYLAMYHNGRLAFERTDMVYRTNSSVGISQLFFSTFFGGSDSSFWASKGGYSYFKDFKFFSGSRAADSSGPEVTATFPADQA